MQQEGWLKGGSYLAVRRVKMFLETWDRTHLQSQEETFGRHRDSGAGIGHQHEFDKLDLAKKDEKGNAVIPEVSHAHLANKTGLKSYAVHSPIQAVLMIKGNLIQGCCLSLSNKVRSNLSKSRTLSAMWIK